MNCGDHQSFQKENLVATVWQDNKPIWVLSTNSRPDATVVINRRHGADTIHVDQPKNVFLYKKNMNAVDRNDQLRAKYNVGRFSVKAWKYLLWFFVNSCIVNAYILYAKTSTRRTKKRYTHLDFWLEVAHGLIGHYSAQKWKSNAEAMADARKATHESVYMGATHAKRCKWHLMQKWHRKET